ncbi:MULTISPECIES: alpha/beta fold hydrolase [unclassified Bradyrhizobium]
MYRGQGSILRTTASVIQSSSCMNSGQICVCGRIRFATFRGPRCIAYNARGYPPSDVPDDPAAYGWERAVEDLASLMQELDLSRAHIVGQSMGAYTALHYGLKYQGCVSAIVGAAAGSGSLPSQRGTWLRETEILARGFVERGLRSIAEQMAKSAIRVQLKYKDPKRWQQFIDQLQEQLARGMANTLVRCQAMRPPLHELRDAFSKMATPVLLLVGDEDTPCLEANLMLKSMLLNAGLSVVPNTGHGINLEEPAVFNAQVDAFLSAVERNTWRRSYPTSRTEQTGTRCLNQRSHTDAVAGLGQDRGDATIIPLRPK